MKYSKFIWESFYQNVIMVSKKSYDFTMKMKMKIFSSTKTLVTTNISITSVKKDKKIISKFTLDILNYTLIKNLRQWILIMKWDKFGNLPLSKWQVST